MRAPGREPQVPDRPITSRRSAKAHERAPAFSRQKRIQFPLQSDHGEQKVLRKASLYSPCRSTSRLVENTSSSVGLWRPPLDHAGMPHRFGMNRCRWRSRRAMSITILAPREFAGHLPLSRGSSVEHHHVAVDRISARRVPPRPPAFVEAGAFAAVPASPGCARNST